MTKNSEQTGHDVVTARGKLIGIVRDRRGRRVGHQRIGLAVGPERFVPAQRKAAEFRRLMAPVVGSADDVDKLIVHSLFAVEGGHSAVSSLLDQDCTAVVCGSDLMALGAIQVARKRGLSVPWSATTTRR